MGSNKHTKITLIIVTMAIAAVISLFASTIAITPRQADTFSRYDPSADDAGPAADITQGKTDQKLRQDDIGNTAKPASFTPTLPAMPTVRCAMDTIESLQSFLSCLGEVITD